MNQNEQAGQAQEFSDDDLDTVTGGTGGRRNIKPVRVMKRIDQATPLVSGEPGSYGNTTIGADTTGGDG